MIVITVPHGKANQNTAYDVGALAFLPYLESALIKRNIHFSSHVGDSHRELVDLNRKEAYGTEYYRELCILLKRATFHLDLHSFPFVAEDASDDDAITGLGDDLRAWSAHSVVLLDCDGVTHPVILNNLTELLEKRFDIGIFDIAGEGAYLMTVASVLFDLPSILMEVNDRSSEEFEALADSLAAFLVDFA